MKLKQFIGLLENGKRAVAGNIEGSNDLDRIFGDEIANVPAREELEVAEEEFWNDEDEEIYPDELDSLIDEATEQAIDALYKFLANNVSWEVAHNNNPINSYILNKVAKMCRDDRGEVVKQKLKTSIYNNKNKFLSNKEVKEYHKFVHVKSWYDYVNDIEEDSSIDRYAPYYEIDGVGLHGEFVMFNAGEEPPVATTIQGEISSDMNIDEDYNPSIFEVFGIEAKK